MGKAVLSRKVWDFTKAGGPLKGAGEAGRGKMEEKRYCILYRGKI